MHENDFEKQVKDMMEAYRLSPSASVWEKVKQRISKRRRRVWPFALLLVCVITAGYFVYDSTGSRKGVDATSEKTAAVKKENNLSATRPEASAEKNNKVPTVAAQNTRPLKTGNTNQENKKTFEPSLNNNHHQNSFLLSQAKSKRPDNNMFDDYKNSVLNNNQQQKDNNNLTDEKNKAALHKPNADKLLQQDAVAGTNKSSTETMISSDNGQQKVLSSINDKADTSVVKNNQSLITQQNDVINTNDSLVKQAEPLIKKSAAKQRTTTGKNNAFKWQYGAIAMYGAGNITRNLFSLHLSSEKSLGNNISAGGTSRIDTSSISSRAFKYNDAFKAGFTVQRRINKNMSISSGINYTQLSNTAHVTRRIEYIANSPDVIADITYAPQSSSTIGLSTISTSSQQTVTSVYRFIEVPVQWQQNFTNGKKVSFSYNAGFSVMRLLSSKALIYDENKNIYFFKDDALRKTQFQLGGGLNMQISLNPKYTLTVGPQLGYSLTNSLKNSDYGKYHYITYGLQAGIILHK